MRYIFTLILLFVSNMSHAATVYKLDLTYSKIINNHDPMLYEVESADWSNAVTFEAGIETQGKLFYLEPNFHFESCYSKVCAVGLQFETGIRAANWLSFMYQHHSRHSADRMNDSDSVTRYPLYDAVGVRISFITGGKL